MSLVINSILRTGGNIGINVIGGTTRPASPPDKTIWVNTSLSITLYVFSASEPVSPSNGMVWIKTGSSSPVAFNASEENNELWIYPTNCNQYINGSWVSKDAESYLDGVWTQWSIWLFQYGAGQVVPWDKYWANNGVVSFDNNAITLSSDSSAYPERAAFTENAIDLTDINTVCFDILCESGDTTVVFCGITTDTTINYVQPSGILNNPEQTSRHIMTVDVSRFSGFARVVIWAKGASKQHVYNVYLQ